MTTSHTVTTKKAKVQSPRPDASKFQDYVCDHCSKPFPAERPAVYCSNRCKMASRNRKVQLKTGVKRRPRDPKLVAKRATGRRGKLPARPCAHCQVDFRPTHGLMKYCAVACRTAANNTAVSPDFSHALTRNTAFPATTLPAPVSLGEKDQNSPTVSVACGRPNRDGIVIFGRVYEWQTGLKRLPKGSRPNHANPYGPFGADRGRMAPVGAYGCR
jgi:hypothetical protein